MDTKFQIRKLKYTDRKTILKIADWYYKEWKAPKAKTINRLSNLHEGALFFQLVVTHDEDIIAIGGLSDKVNLLNVYPEYGKFGPWVTLLYTHEQYRNRGVGSALLNQIELEALSIKISKIYLYTFTAESLYKRLGWRSFETVDYKNHPTLLMEKELTQIKTNPKNC